VRQLVARLVNQVWRWIQGNKMLAVVLALGLIAVPTATGLVPGYVYRQDRTLRFTVFVVWLFVAGLVTIATQDHQSESDARELAIQQTTQSLQRSQIYSALGTLLSPDHSKIPGAYTPHVYLDNGAGHLLMWFPDLVSDIADVHSFAYDHGVTGKAFVAKEERMAVGPAVSGPDWGLTEEQQREFANDKVVVGIPIRMIGNPVIGVLTVASTVNDGFYCDVSGTTPHEARINELWACADRISRVFDQYKGGIV
jgi:hypothetical protein